MHGTNLLRTGVSDALFSIGNPKEINSQSQDPDVDCGDPSAVFGGGRFMMSVVPKGGSCYVVSR